MKKCKAHFPQTNSMQVQNIHSRIQEGKQNNTDEVGKTEYTRPFSSLQVRPEE